MMRRLLIAAVVMASSAAGLLAAWAGGSPVGVRANPPRGCPSLSTFARGAPGLASGRGLWAVAGGRLVSVGAGRAVTGDGLLSVGRSRTLATATDQGTIKHVAVRPGIGTAYVIDRAGADIVVAMTRKGADVLPQAAEASDPTWSASGLLAWSTGSAILIRNPVSGKIDELPGPVQGAGVFAPVFLSDHRIATVVSERPNDQVPEGEQLNDLWSTDIAGTRWRRLTHFRAGADDWVAVRTPIARAGGIDFVRVTARGSSTVAPTFELWRYAHGAVSRVRRLAGERYLAGRLRGQPVWNRPDPSNNRFLLEIERAGGMRTIGCGAVMVDPIDVPDPDLRSGGSYVPLREERERADLGMASDAGAEEVSVIVGDFQTVAEAQAVVTEIQRAYPGSLVNVIENDDAPLAIRPGVFGALLHLPRDADPGASIAAFRAALPAYTSNSWIVTP